MKTQRQLEDFQFVQRKPAYSKPACSKPPANKQRLSSLHERDLFCSETLQLLSKRPRLYNFVEEACVASAKEAPTQLRLHTVLDTAAVQYGRLLQREEKDALIAGVHFVTSMWDAGSHSMWSTTLCQRANDEAETLRVRMQDHSVASSKFEAGITELDCSRVLWAASVDSWLQAGGIETI
jgi:hypothetical protein